jgi:hypothetical protein
MRRSYGALRLWSTVLILRALADVAEYVQEQQSGVR